MSFPLTSVLHDDALTDIPADTVAVDGRILYPVAYASKAYIVSFIASAAGRYSSFVRRYSHGVPRDESSGYRPREL